MPDNNTRTSGSSVLPGLAMSRIERCFLFTRRASMKHGSEGFAARVSVLRSEFDNLFRSRNFDRQTPLALFISAQRRMQPPASRRHGDRQLSLFVETRIYRRAAVDALLKKIVEALAGALFGEELVTDGDDINLIKIHSDVESRIDAVRRLAQHDLHRRRGATASLGCGT